MKVNLGCGEAYMDGWVNVDANPAVRADIHLDVVEFVRQYGPEIEELYMGHVIEHLMPAEALVTLSLLNERTPVGTTISAVTPDMAAIFRAYLDHEVSNDTLNLSFVYSYIQPSHHVWCHDENSLRELFDQAGLNDVAPVDPGTWPPVFHKSGTESRWQCGIKGVSTGRRAVVIEAPALPVQLPGERNLNGQDAVTSEEALLVKVRWLREEAVREASGRLQLEYLLRDVTRGPAQNGQVVAATAAGDRFGNLSSSDEDESAQGDYASKRLQRRKVLDHLMPPGSGRRLHARASLIAARQTGAFLRAGDEFVRNVIKGYGQTLRGRTSESQSGSPYRLPRVYSDWVERHDATADDLSKQHFLSATSVRPTSFLVLVDDTCTGEVDATIDSVLAQSWSHWQLEVYTGGRRKLSGGRPDPRVRLRRCGDNAVEKAFTDAVVGAGRDFIVFLESGDLLSPDCLFQLHAAAWSDPLIDLITFDDDLVDSQNLRQQPRFKPEWSPETLFCANYIGRAFAMRSRRFLFAGGLREDRGKARLWDLLLRSDLNSERATRIPRILAHLKHRDDVDPAEGLGVVEDHVRAVDLPADVHLVDGRIRLNWNGIDWPSVSIVIPTRHNRVMLSRLLESLSRTEYGGSLDITVIDNGPRSGDNESWYDEYRAALDLQVHWWRTDFNYSAVNNFGATRTFGEVLVFLNDDMEIVDHDWLAELVGWAVRPEIGVAGLQLLDLAGSLQHAGAFLGLNGFADHLFEGMDPKVDTLLGRTDWYRNVLAVTGACLAIRRGLFEKLGGFDERFILCGSDVALGLDAVIHGFRNVCSPYGRIIHAESTTRGTNVPAEDFFASYWRYSPWVFGGDPYLSPNISLTSRRPALAQPDDPTPHEMLEAPLGRSMTVFRQRDNSEESRNLAHMARARAIDADIVRQTHALHSAPFDVRTVNWYIPDIDSPFYGGINTALRLADYLAKNHGVQNRFIVWGSSPEGFVRSALAAAYPSLGSCPIYIFKGITAAELAGVPAADVGIATLWLTAFSLLRTENIKRRFYLIQDFEPMFYPASTQYAVSEASYHLGLYGLCNTENLARIYRLEYGGKAASFMPAVDRSVFHANGRRRQEPGVPATVFVYARPGHWRNCWEIASLALEELKMRLGDGVRIVTAGSWAVPDHGAGGMRHLGLLDYRATGELYRKADVGLALTLSKHPSYLPLELMACGVPVVAFNNPWGHWILRNGENCLLAERTVDDLVDKLDRLCTDVPFREYLQAQGLQDIAARHSSWDHAFSDVYELLCDPERVCDVAADISSAEGAAAPAAQPVI